MKKVLLILLLFYGFSGTQARVAIPLDSKRIYYEGIWFPEISSARVILNRHTESVLIHPESGISSTSKPYAYTQSCVRIRFKTSSPTIVMSFEERTPGGKMGLRNGFAVYVSGKRTEVFESLTFTITNPVNNNPSVEYEVVLPSIHAVNFIGLSLDDNYTLDEITPINKPVCAVIGNSISHGTGQQSASFLTYPFILANELGWDLYNLAVAGARTGWPIARLFKDKKVDYITIEIGFNDWMWDNKPLSDKSAQYNRLLDTLRYYQKSAKIFCITPVITTQTNPQLGSPFKLDEFRHMVRDIVRQKQDKGDKNIYLLHGDSLSNASMLLDGIHFNETGASQFALNLKNAIKSILDTQTSLNDPEYNTLNNYSFELNQNFPNPFNPGTRINYKLGAECNVKLVVYDLLGRTVSTLIDGRQSAGNYSAVFNAANMSGGVYIYELITPEYIKSMKMTVLK